MENVESGGKILCEFRKLATENNIRRLDDDFLRRFLVGHRYDVCAALKAIRNFQSFIERRQDNWLKLEKGLVENILESQIIDVLDEVGRHGQTIVWIRLEKWDPEVFSADEILKVSALLCELVYAKMKEIKFIDVIMDMHSFSLKHLNGLSMKFAKRMVFFMSECLPMELLHIYVVRQPKIIFYLGYALYKPFVEERMKKIIHICGDNYDYLTKNIGRDFLPVYFNGTCENLKSTRWLNVMHQRKIRQDLSLSGYEFYEKSTGNT
ncbi:alpha-tocopherol transfer protein-like [Anoplophora glabripennis]|uniref:alpha-tocopherol transfer protein-like n=1 Tax=Anoplophora glabripennis TaxID=217634 RepID=UPI000874BB9B|nr:alpha-tocopherol transfer protein-like [Anoplophora glabripennis]